MRQRHEKMFIILSMIQMLMIEEADPFSTGYKK